MSQFHVVCFTPKGVFEETKQRFVLSPTSHATIKRAQRSADTINEIGDIEVSAILEIKPDGKICHHDFAPSAQQHLTAAAKTLIGCMGIAI